jgi:hypothetical protein
VPDPPPPAAEVPAIRGASREDAASRAGLESRSEPPRRTEAESIVSSRQKVAASKVSLLSFERVRGAKEEGRERKKIDELFPSLLLHNLPRLSLRSFSRCSL